MHGDLAGLEVSLMEFMRTFYELLDLGIEADSCMLFT
jgi:hypothetical protein